MRASARVKAYLVDLVRATRDHPDVLVGASPRAILTTFRCCQALTMLRNDPEVTYAHVRELFAPCIEHRLRVRDGASASAVIVDMLERVPEPAAEEPAARERRLSVSRGRRAAAAARSCSSTKGSSVVVAPPARREVLGRDPGAQRRRSRPPARRRPDGPARMSRSRSSSSSSPSSGSRDSSGVEPDVVVVQREQALELVDRLGVVVDAQVERARWPSPDVVVRLPRRGSPPTDGRGGRLRPRRRRAAQRADGW